MNLLLDFLPILAFVIAYKFAGIFVATGVLVVGVVAMAAMQWIRERKVNSLMLISAVLVLVLGGITLVLHDETFIQWKPTVASTAFALVFLFSAFIGKKTMVEQMMGEVVQLPPSTWKKINYIWTVFWLVMALVNAWMVRSFDLTTWVNWHLPVLFGLSVVFFLVNGYWISTKMPPENESADSSAGSGDPTSGESISKQSSPEKPEP